MSDDRVWKIETAARMEAPREVSMVRGAAAAYCNAPTREPDDPNQDSLAVLETSYGGIILAVADGVGGHADGARASRIAMETLAQAVRDSAVSPLRAAILDAFEHANREVMELGSGAATTLSVVSIDEDGVRSYHAGDSQAMIVGQRGRLKFTTMAHSPVGYALEAGLLDHDEAMEHEERHLISNLVGSEKMHIQIGPGVPLAARDTVVVGSDGVFDNASLEEITDLVRIGPLAEATVKLVEHCLARMQGEMPGPSKPDDLSVIVYRPSS